MPLKFSNDFLPLLYNALDEEMGTYIRTDNGKQLRKALYEARTNATDESLDELMLFLPLPDTVLIAKRSTELPDDA